MNHNLRMYMKRSQNVKGFKKNMPYARHAEASLERQALLAAEQWKERRFRYQHVEYYHRGGLYCKFFLSLIQRVYCWNRNTCKQKVLVYIREILFCLYVVNGVSFYWIKEIKVLYYEDFLYKCLYVIHAIFLKPFYGIHVF